MTAARTTEHHGRIVVGVDGSPASLDALTLVFPAPLMSTIGELGAFLARETAAAGALPPAPALPATARIDAPNGSRPATPTHN